jgi:hypothetical protein
MKEEIMIETNENPRKSKNSGNNKAEFWIKSSDQSAMLSGASEKQETTEDCPSAEEQEAKKVYASALQRNKGGNRGTKGLNLGIKPIIRSSKNIVLIAMMSVILVLGKFALNFVPNVEVVTLFTMVFSYCFGYLSFAATFVFCLLDNFLYQSSPDVTISYFIYWNALAAFAATMRRAGVRADFAYLLLSMIMTLFFGVLTSFFQAMLFNSSFAAIYVGGLLFYALHLASTLVTMIVLFSPLCKLLQKIRKKF